MLGACSTSLRNRFWMNRDAIRKFRVLSATIYGKRQQMISTVGNIMEPTSPRMQIIDLTSQEDAKVFIVVESLRLCAAAIGDQARAIVLTGSFSRGEATLRRDGAGWRVLGDATFLVVFERPAELRTGELEERIQRHLLAQGIQCKIVVVASTISALRRMKPHIYAYELRERGIVVWGDQTILFQIPQFSVSDIPKEDGWWFLCNRMIEQLESAAQADGGKDHGASVRYRIAKLYLAMAACYLLTIGQYRPSYKERAERLRELAEFPAPPPSPIPLRRFSRLVSECTSLKLQGSTTDTYGEFPQWEDAVSDAEALWRWVLGQVSGTNSSCSRSVLLNSLAMRQTVFARAKGWVRAVYVRPAAFCRDWLRWVQLACLASPRYLVYGAASDLFFTTSEGEAVRQDWLVEIAAKLPLRPHEEDQQLSWRKVAMMVAHNFHDLLESNRS